MLEPCIYHERLQTEMDKAADRLHLAERNADINAQKIDNIELAIEEIKSILKEIQISIVNMRDIYITKNEFNKRIEPFENKPKERYDLIVSTFITAFISGIIGAAIAYLVTKGTTP
jgi:hypothetical protein